MKRIVRFIALASAAAGVGCSSSDPASAPPPTCVDAGIDPSCAPAYEPTYDAIYAHTFEPTCAKSGASCHGHSGKQGGIDFEDPEAAFAALRAHDVTPGDPACSKLVQTLVSTDPFVRMPPGASLPAGEQCAIVRWVAAGAQR